MTEEAPSPSCLFKKNKKPNKDQEEEATTSG